MLNNFLVCFLLFIAGSNTYAFVTHKHVCCNKSPFQDHMTVQRRPHFLKYNKNSNICEDASTIDDDTVNKSILEKDKFHFDDDVTNDIQVNDKRLIQVKDVLLILIISSLALYVSGVSNGVDLTDLLKGAVSKIEDMGPLGYVYFSGIYVLAEIFAVPAFPLTASSGYLFGLIPGFIIVLVSATAAAGISFLIGRTYLRDWAQDLATKYGGDRWNAIDSAISKEGFKVVLLLRLSPLLPFALSNYLYGLTSVEFWQFLCGTCLGFSPGTFGIVYAGTAGKDLFSGTGGFPWYFYVLGAIVVAAIGGTISNIASAALENISCDGEDIDDTSL